jgi:hypothetical protein
MYLTFDPSGFSSYSWRKLPATSTSLPALPFLAQTTHSPPTTAYNVGFNYGHSTEVIPNRDQVLICDNKPPVFTFQPSNKQRRTNTAPPQEKKNPPALPYYNTRSKETRIKVSPVVLFQLPRCDIGYHMVKNEPHALVVLAKPYVWDIETLWVWPTVSPHLGRFEVVAVDCDTAGGKAGSKGSGCGDEVSAATWNCGGRGLEVGWAAQQPRVNLRSLTHHLRYPSLWKEKSKD